MAKSLSFWKWQGQNLPEQLQWTTKELHEMDEEELTAYCLDSMRNTSNNEVRNCIEANPNIVRLVSLKEFRVRGNITKATIDLSRPERLQAISGYIFIRQTNIKPCGPCSDKKSKGPCKTCISTGKEMWKGACSNCQYSGRATSCSIRHELEVQDEAVKIFDDARNFSLEWLELQRVSDLEKFQNQLELELARRKSGSIPSKSTVSKKRKL